MIFNEFARHILGEVTRLGNRVASSSKEARQVMILLACAGGARRGLVQAHLGGPNGTLPSWVPDWTAPPLSRPFVFDPRFQAGGETLEVDWDHEAGLQLCGKLLDTIQVAGTVLLENSADGSASDAHDNIEQWWQESLSLACTRTVRSPGSTMNVDAFEGLCRDLGICSEYIVYIIARTTLTFPQNTATLPANMAVLTKMTAPSPNVDAACSMKLSCIKRRITAHSTLLLWDPQLAESYS